MATSVVPHTLAPARPVPSPVGEHVQVSRVEYYAVFGATFALCTVMAA